MSRDLTKCPCCSCKIGFKTANGRFRYTPNKASQIVLTYGYPGMAAKTQVHVVVCKTCCSDSPATNIAMAMSEDKALVEFLSNNPTAVLEGKSVEAEL